MNELRTAHFSDRINRRVSCGS